MQDNKLRYAVYTRKSTEEEERQVLSLASQRDKIMERFGDLKIVAEFSESKSAFEPDKRPKFKELLELIDAGKADDMMMLQYNLPCRKASISRQNLVKISSTAMSASDKMANLPARHLKAT